MKLSDIIRQMADEGASASEVADFVDEYEKDRAAMAPWSLMHAAAVTQGGRVCAYCDETEGPFVLDHIIPRSRGGTRDLYNLTVACWRCNSSKRDRLLSEWSGRKGARRSA